MDAEAAAVPPGCDGVTMVPDFLASGDRKGSINGLVLGRTRGHIYRAAMEALTWRLKSRLRRLESVGGFKSEFLILVGGGARNRVWTQMRRTFSGFPSKSLKCQKVRYWEHPCLPLRAPGCTLRRSRPEPPSASPPDIYAWFQEAAYE
ncbi:MAG: FGGY-family carbohydrate kinase [Akkermansia sp.]